MKKTMYIQPQTAIVLVSAQEAMLAASNTLSSDGKSIEFNYETIQDGDGSNAAVKAGNVFDGQDWETW